MTSYQLWHVNSAFPICHFYPKSHLSVSNSLSIPNWPRNSAATPSDGSAISSPLLCSILRMPLPCNACNRKLACVSSPFSHTPRHYKAHWNSCSNHVAFYPEFLTACDGSHRVVRHLNSYTLPYYI